jgi:pseudaminic acid biosynthesis-associated methylase
VSQPALDAWRTDFGDAYTERNAPTDMALAQRLNMWARILQPLTGSPPTSILEAGANLGLNLRALRLLTGAALTAVEPNATARQRLVEDGIVPADRIHDGICSSLPVPDASHDLVFTSGVLIHVPPADLEASCRELHRVSARWLLAVEYNSEQPVELPYRDREGLLFKRDFGAFYLSLFPALRIRDYGFFWRPATGLDNLTWWLFEKV